MNEKEYSENTNTTEETSEQASVTEQKKKKKPPFVGEFYDYFELFIISACAVLLLFSFVTRLCRVDGPSMLNSLHDGEMLLVSDVLYNPERGDIVVFHQTGTLNEPVVKRVIATEGEWIGILKKSDDTLTVTIYDKNRENPRVLEEPYANYQVGVGPYSYTGEPIQVPEGCIFVMGDNRGNSLDSRSQTIGFVDTRRVLGKVVCRITPFDKFGSVD